MTGKITTIALISLVLVIAHSARSQEPMEYTALVIEYIGESDRAVKPIVISDSKEGAEWCRTAVVDKHFSLITSVQVVGGQLMAELITEVSTYRDNPLQGTRKLPKSWDTVLVTVVTHNSRNSFSLTADPGLSLLGGLKALSKGEDPLRSDLLQFESQITANRETCLPQRSGGRQ